MDGAAVVGLVVIRAEEGRVAVKSLRAEGQLVAEEIRLGERNLGIRTLDTVLPADTEALAAADEARPAEDVEIRLLQLGKTDQAVDCAEAGAEVERSCALLLDDDIQVLAAGDHRVRRHSLDLREIVEVLQTLAAGVDQRGVISVARSDSQLATDNVVLRARVALDIDQIDERLSAFVDAVGDIDQTAAGRGYLRHDQRIDVALGSVKLLQRLEIFTQPVRRVERPIHHFETAFEFVGSGDIDTVEAEAVDRVLDALADGEDEFDVVAGKRDDFDVRHLRVGKALVLVGQTDGVAVFLQLRRHQPAALVHEGEQVLRFGLHRLAQVLGQHRVVADEIDALHDLFVSFVDLENDTRVARAIVGVDARGDVDPAEIPVLVKLDHGLARLLHLLLAEAVAHFEGQLFAQAVRRDFHRTFDKDLGHHRASLHQDDHPHAVALRLGKDAHVGHVAGGKKGSHIVLRRALRIGIADFGFEIGHDPLTTDRFGPDILNIDRTDDRAGRRGRLRRGLRQERKRSQKGE